MTSVCRVCLVGNTLRSVKDKMLRNLYEKLTNTKFNSDDARSRALCSFCYQKLLRCHTFSQMALTSEKIFNHVYDMGIEVTQDYITEVNLNKRQHLSVAVMPFISNDVRVTNVGSQVTIKDELQLIDIDIKEEVITEPDKLPKIANDCLNNQSTLKDISNLDNDTEKLLSKTNIDQFKLSSIDIKEEITPEQDIDIKEEVIAEPDKLPEIPKDCSNNQVTLIEDIRNWDNDTEKLLSKTNINQLNISSIYIKEEITPEQYIDIKEEVTAEPDKMPEIPKDCSNNQATSIEDNWDNDIEKLLSKTDIDQSKLSSVDIKEEITPEPDKLVEIESFPTTKSRITFEEDHSDPEKDTVELVHVKKTKLDDSKMTFSCNNCNKIFDIKSKSISHSRYCHSKVTEKEYSTAKKHIEDKAIHNKKKKLAGPIYNKVFDTESHLICPVRTPTCQKPFACNVCEKQFYHKSHITRTHTENSADQVVFGPSELVEKTQSSKMLLFLQNGEQRLITFTLEKSCTLLEILEQVYIPFSEDTRIQCMRSRTGGIDFFVTVGLNTRIEEVLANHQMLESGRSSRISPRVEDVSCDQETDLETILNKNFINKKSYAVKKRDDSKKPFNCNDCNKIFYIKSKLISHIRKSHTQVTEKPTKKHIEKSRSFLKKTLIEQKKFLNKKKKMIRLKQIFHKGHIKNMRNRKENTEAQGQSPSEQASGTQTAKMLIFLQNGEQRLITFTIENSCTLQEILEQVCIPFSEDTNIQCMRSQNSEIEYFVSLGSTTRIEETLQNHPMFVDETDSRNIPSIMARPKSKEVSPSKKSSSNHVEGPESPGQSSLPLRLVEGMLALCKPCGYTGYDFNRCERCKRLFTEEPKRVENKKAEQKKKEEERVAIEKQSMHK